MDWPPLDTKFGQGEVAYWKRDILGRNWKRSRRVRRYPRNHELPHGYDETGQGRAKKQAAYPKSNGIRSLFYPIFLTRTGVHYA